MDRNSIVGIVLICVVLFVFSIMNQPSKEQLAEQQRVRDSVEQVQKVFEDSLRAKVAPVKVIEQAHADSSLSDSAKAVLMEQQFGAFSDAANGTPQFYTIENDLLKITLTNKGGKIFRTELKNYKTYDGLPLVINNSDSSVFGLNFFSQNKSISTDNLFFEPGSAPFNAGKGEKKSFVFRLNAGSGKYVEYIYTLESGSYRIGYKINFVNLNDVIAANTGYVALDWKQKIQKQEKDWTTEFAKTTVYYKYSDDEVDYLSETADDADDLKTDVHWVAFKQQFFTTVLIADKTFDNPTHVSAKTSTDSTYVKYLEANFTIPYLHKPTESVDMSIYAGPCHYQTLKKYDIGLEKQIPLGWGIIGWVNRFAVIPVFNFLNSFDLNYGIIIIILTMVIKIALLPLTYRSYISTAKMRVVQPEVAEIQAKKKEDPLKMQQEIMQLYRKAGVSPLGGCFPMLLQLPILIAMFNFFPSSIELRQEPFLWANDLSTYDSVLNLPFEIPFYGSHVSLFAILMTISTILYTKLNSSQMPQTGPNAQMMKIMMYVFPVLFLGVMNKYSAGLSYYIFVANMLTFGQQWLFRKFVDEKAIHAKIQENKKKPMKKSAFQERLEKMAKERGVKMK